MLHLFYYLYLGILQGGDQAQVEGVEDKSGQASLAFAQRRDAVLYWRAYNLHINVSKVVLQ